MSEGTIINIQKYSVHDGPGIRTTTFFKGCPLRCWWCHNPETHLKRHEIMFFEDRCTTCGRCVENCPSKAIEIKDSHIVTDNDKCTLCGRCTDVCLNEAKEFVGSNITASDLMKELLKDQMFYEQSNGGVTFSGGEPMLYADFLNEVLTRCKRVGLHTAIETSGYAPWEEFGKIIDKVDLFLYDLKIMDNEKHKKYIGADNKLILDNLTKICEENSNVIIRMPIIAGINDNCHHIEEVIKYISNLNIIEVNLLPYHKMGMDKYKRVNKTYQLTGNEVPTNEKMNEFAEMFKKAGIKVKIGG